MASINDVAKLANVAKSTVSAVINNNGYVSDKTRIKVEKAMKELNYIPSQLAKNLSTKRSNIVGIVMPDVMHPFFATFIKEAEIELNKKGYMTMICGTVGREKIEQEYLDMLNRRAMDGIIMGVHTLDIEKYKETTRPIVTLDRYINEKIPLVTSNHVQAAKLSVDLLLKHNVKHVVQFIGSDQVTALMADDYARCCGELLMKKGIKVDYIQMKLNSFKPEDYDEAAKSLFEKYPDVDAVIGVDMVILSVLKEAKIKEYQVPQKLKLLAYDGTFVTRMNERTLTAIVQPIEEMAKVAVNAVIEQIESENKKEIRNYILDVSVQKGETF